MRLIYTFEAMWKAAAVILEEKEGVAVGSPKAAIRASRRVGLLSDDDTRDALRMAEDRNLSVHMYRGQIGAEIGQRLASHAEVLGRWLDALRSAATEDT